MSVLRRLPRLDAPPPVDAGLVAERRQHPMRQVTERVAGDEQSWATDDARAIAAFFDDLAPGWNERIGGPAEGHLTALADALDRGEVSGRLALDLGSGTGAATELIQTCAEFVVGVDLATEMLGRAPVVARAARLCADSARLPVPEGAADVVVLLNTFLFPAEVARVLAPSGVVVWANSDAERTPIHLPGEEVHAALPGEWQGVVSEAGPGSWCVLRRADG